MNLLNLRASFQSIARSQFIRSVSVLVGGTAFAQGLTVLVLPLLTRLYTPEDFGLLAVYTSILSLISVVACMRLDIAIPIAETEEEAVNLLALAMTTAILIASTVMLLVLLFPRQLGELLNQQDIVPYLPLLPLGIVLIGGYNACQYWATRSKRFKRIALTRAEQAVGSVGVQLLSGWYNPTPFGLIVGQVVKSGAGLFGLLRKMFNEDRAFMCFISPTNMLRTLRKYSYFPRYSSAEALANSASIQLPIILIAASSGDKVAGFIALSMRVLFLPMSFLGSSIAQVYLSKASEKWRAGELDEFSLQVLKNLIRVGVGPLIFLGALAPEIFTVVFGANWTPAGEIVRWMVPWFILQFLASPISMSLQVTHNQKLALGLQIYGLCIRVFPVWLAATLYNQLIAETYALTGFVFYATYILVILRVTQIEFEEIKKLMYRILKAGFLWGGAATLILCVYP